MDKNFGTWIVKGQGGSCGAGMAAMVQSQERMAYWTNAFLEAGAVLSYELMGDLS